jgi:putative acetyltransferase
MSGEACVLAWSSGAEASLTRSLYRTRTITMLIRQDDLTGSEIAALLEAHLQLMRDTSPPESVHALDLEKLRLPEVTFWTLWDGDELLGCGALKDLGEKQGGGHGEIKSMHTARAARGRGVARRLVEHIIAEARARGYRRLSLETGSVEAFAPARALYAGFGFETCGPFAGYRLDPFSAFMTLELE